MFSRTLERNLLRIWSDSIICLLSMVNINEYEHLKLKYGLYSSWTIWDYKNERDTSIITQNYDKLHSRYILIGLNISASLNEEPWSNFHSGRHDRKLKYATNDNELRGSYITDLFKGIAESNSTKLASSLSNDIIKKNVYSFNKELKDLKINDKSEFIIFGTLAANYFDKYFKQGYKNNVIYYRHYSNRGTDKDWVNGFWNKLNIVQNFETTVSKYK